MKGTSAQKNRYFISTALLFSILFLLGLTYGHSLVLAQSAAAEEKKPAHTADTASSLKKETAQTDQESSLETMADTDEDAALDEEEVTDEEAGLEPAEKAAVDEDSEKNEEAASVDQNLLPHVVITPFGEEYNIKVTYNHPMDFKSKDYIEYVRMETLKGESLGIKAFSEGSTEAAAEFMVNPKLAKFDTFQLVANSTTAGLIKSTHKLQPTSNKDRPSGEGSGQASAKPAKKKLFGLWEF